jgi:hypothetical protein
LAVAVGSIEDGEPYRQQCFGGVKHHVGPCGGKPNGGIGRGVTLIKAANENKGK